MKWNKIAESKFQEMIDRVPGPMQGLARDKVTQKAQDIAAKANLDIIDEKELIDAFFEATPFGFHGPMKCDMEKVGLDYTKYGYER